MLQKKIQDLRQEAENLQNRLGQLDKERQEITTELIKKIGSLETVEELQRQYEKDSSEGEAPAKD